MNHLIERTNKEQLEADYLELAMPQVALKYTESKQKEEVLCKSVY